MAVGEAEANASGAFIVTISVPVEDLLGEDMSGDVFSLWATGSEGTVESTVIRVGDVKPANAMADAMSDQ